MTTTSSSSDILLKFIILVLCQLQKTLLVTKNIKLIKSTIFISSYSYFGVSNTYKLLPNLHRTRKIIDYWLGTPKEVR